MQHYFRKNAIDLIIPCIKKTERGWGVWYGEGSPVREEATWEKSNQVNKK